MQLYEKVLRELLASGAMNVDDSVFVSCGGSYDAETLRKTGFKNVTIGNLDDQYDGACEPFQWQLSDAEALGLADNSVDWGIVHAGLHHCASPHRGLLELCRIARKGVIAFEARDSSLMRAAVKLGMTGDYEIESVALHPQQLGGLRHGSVPNYIYRWTEREIVKTVESAHPDRVNDFRFFYHLRLPTERLTMSGPVKRAVARVGGAIVTLAVKLFPRQSNEFAFAVLATPDDKPWITRDAAGPRLNPAYRLGFDPKAYVRGG